jgi:hypothetical protein
VPALATAPGVASGVGDAGKNIVNANAPSGLPGNGPCGDWAEELASQALQAEFTDTERANVNMTVEGAAS